MQSITLFSIEFLPHTWPLVFGVPSLLITSVIAGGIYELIKGQ